MVNALKEVLVQKNFLQLGLSSLQQLLDLLESIYMGPEQCALGKYVSIFRGTEAFTHLSLIINAYEIHESDLLAIT